MTPDEHTAEALRLAGEALVDAVGEPDGRLMMALVGLIHATLAGPAPVEPPSTYVPRGIQVGDPDPTDPEYDGKLCEVDGCAWPLDHMPPPVPWQVTKARRDAKRIKDLLASGEDPEQATSLECDLLAATARAVVAGQPWARDMAVEAVAVLDTDGTRWTA